MRKWLLVVAAVAGILAGLARSSLAVSTVTITGTWVNVYNDPCVYCHLDVYALYSSVNSSGSGTLISSNPIQVETNTSGAFTATVVGGITAALYFEETGGLIKTTLPASGSVTLAQIQALQPNVVSSFPPSGNLPMGGNRFTGMSGGQASGDSVAVGLGLDSAALQAASGSYSFPVGATYAEILMCGGGGGGGGGGTSGHVGGGGAGPTCMSCLMLATQGAITVTLGAAGIGQVAGSDGGNGGITMAVQNGGVYAECNANGGSGGKAGTGSANGAAGSASSAGSALGPAQILWNQVSVGGGTASGGATNQIGEGTGLFGGNGGAVSSTGSNGEAGKMIIWAF